ncbi:MAG: hypothetical protein IJM50_03920 [Lachnospiraceae bacterium]|nr:hypothetical protein [Lachnospiraceae bacterium]
MAKIYEDQKGPKDEWAKLKNEPLKVKLEWLIQYYGLAALFTLIGVFTLVSIIVTVILNSRPCVIAGEFYCTGSDISYNERMKEDLCSVLGMDPKKTRIDISNTAGDYSGGDSVIQIQRLSARLTARDIDFVVGSQKVFHDFTNPSDIENSAFMNLKKFLPDALYKKLDEEGRIKTIFTDFGQIPYYIDIIGTRFGELYGCREGQIYLGVTFNTQNPEAAIALIERYLAE